MSISFVFVSADKRTGRGWSVYAAIIAAIGAKEASRFVTNTLPCTWQDIKPGDAAPEGCTRVAMILTPERSGKHINNVIHGNVYR